MEDVLTLTLKDVMERRLQTLVFRKNLASSVSQARQFIVHEHISLGDKKITAPSYLVPVGEEGTIQFSQGSVISKASHPIRAVVDERKKQRKAEEKAKKETIVSNSSNKAQTKEEETLTKEGEKVTVKEKSKEDKTKVPSAHDLKKEKNTKKDSKKPEKKEE